jgi:hypothetical protein
VKEARAAGKCTIATCSTAPVMLYDHDDTPKPTIVTVQNAPSSYAVNTSNR